MNIFPLKRQELFPGSVVQNQDCILVDSGYCRLQHSLNNIIWLDLLAILIACVYAYSLIESNI